MGDSSKQSHTRGRAGSKASRKDKKGKKKQLIRFAPLSIPFARRKQTAAVLLSIGLPFLITIFNLILAYYWRKTWLYFVLFATWVFWDRETPYRNGRAFRFIRNLRLWKHFRDYFPMNLIVEKKLQKGRPYIICFHPHGIISLGLWGNFAGTWGKLEEKLGISYRMATVYHHFFFPIWRDFLLGMGFVDARRKTFDYILSHNKAITVVVGGAREALEARPGVNHLVLDCRKGFVKKGLEYGASLVPVFSFGENDLYDNSVREKGSKGRMIMEWLRAKLGFSTPLFHGRGVFNYDFGLLPYRSPVTTVVGPPLELPHIPSPTREDVAKYHKLYVEALQALHDRHKAVHKDINGHVSEMKIIE